jgi:hypothetical protein
MLDPTISSYALMVAGGAGTVAAGMHGTSVASRPGPLPVRRVLVAELIRTWVVGAAAAELIRASPGQWQLLPVLLVAAVVGSTLGPRGLPWLLAAGLAVLRRVLPGGSDLPPPPKEDTDGPH